MQPIPSASLTAAVRTLNVPNVSSSSRDLALVTLCFVRVAFLSARSPRRFFRAKALRLSLNPTCFLPRFLPSFFRRVECSTHSQHASTFPSSTLLLARVRPPSIPTLFASGLTFSAAAVYHGCRGKRFPFVGFHHHQSMLLAGLHCQHRRVLASIAVIKGRRFRRELYSQHVE